MTTMGLILAAVLALHPGDSVTVKREGVRLMKAPRFFGAACEGKVGPGTSVKLLELQKGWARIAAPGAGQCWLHETAWSDRKAGELASSGSGQASSRDVELAGRGFSEGEEARYKGEHAELTASYAVIDALLERAPEPPQPEVERFVTEGKLGGGK